MEEYYQHKKKILPQRFSVQEWFYIFLRFFTFFFHPWIAHEMYGACLKVKSSWLVHGTEWNHVCTYTLTTTASKKTVERSQRHTPQGHRSKKLVKRHINWRLQLQVYCRYYRHTANRPERFWLIVFQTFFFESDAILLRRDLSQASPADCLLCVAHWENDCQHIDL